MGWNSRLAEESGNVKTAGTSSIKLVAKGDDYQVSMNYEGWRALGKRAAFFEDEDDFYPGEESIGETEYYDSDVDEPEDPEDPDGEVGAFINDIEDVEESSIGEAEAAEDAFSTTEDALETTLIGITDESVSEHGIPYLILSALEPISEYRNIDMEGDPIETISNYLGTKPQSEKESAVQDMVRDALAAAKINPGENLI